MTDAGHLSDDPELLEAYARGRLTAGERRIWDEHVAQCAPCREALRQERTLQAGMLLAGREEARRRLRRKLAGEKAVRSEVPWPRIWSIAAAIVVLAGLGIVGRWLALRPGQDEAIQKTRDRVEMAPPTAVDTLTQERGAAAPPEENRAEAPKRAPASPPIAADHPSRHKPVPEPSGPERKTADLAERPRSDKEQRERAFEVQDESKAGGTERQGAAHILGGGAPAGFPQEASPAPAGAARTSGTLSRTATTGADLQEPIRVVFRPAAGRRQKQAPGEEIPALFQRDSTGVRITLLFPPEDSALYAGRPRVVRVGADSVVIVTAGARLGLRVPAR